MVYAYTTSKGEIRLYEFKENLENLNETFSFSSYDMSARFKRQRAGTAINALN